MANDPIVMMQIHMETLEKIKSLKKGLFQTMSDDEFMNYLLNKCLPPPLLESLKSSESIMSASKIAICANRNSLSGESVFRERQKGEHHSSGLHLRSVPLTMRPSSSELSVRDRDNVRTKHTKIYPAKAVPTLSEHRKQDTNLQQFQVNPKAGKRPELPELP